MHNNTGNRTDNRTDEDDRRRQALDIRPMTHTPWWAYPTMFALVAAPIAVGDVADLGLDGSQRVAAMIVAAMLVFLAIRLVVYRGTGPARQPPAGMQTGQFYVPWVAGVLVAAFIAGLWWLVPHYGAEITQADVRATGLDACPDTVAGVLVGAAVTVLIALSRLLNAAVVTRRRSR